MLEFSGLRVTPVTVPAGIGATVDVDITRVQSIVVAEMPRHGTAIGEVSLALGEMGDFWDPSPGDSLHGFFPVRRLRVRNNVATARTITLWLHESADFRVLNNPRGV